jgi:hypothetical protein
MTEDSVTRPLQVCGVAAVAAPPPPHAATASAAIGITTALARKAMGLLRVMSLLRLGSIDSRSNQRLSNRSTDRNEHARGAALSAPSL